MRAWLKSNRKLLIGIVLALGVGLGAGYLFNNGDTGEEPLQMSESVGQIGRPSILPETPVTVTYRFLLCGHTREQDATGGEFTGFTVEQIREKYADASVTRFETDGVVIERELERYCPIHYQVYLDPQGQVVIANTDETDFMQDVQQVLNYDSSELDSESVALLEEGLLLNSLEEINEYFENIES